MLHSGVFMGRAFLRFTATLAKRPVADDRDCLGAAESLGGAVQCGQVVVTSVVQGHPHNLANVSAVFALVVQIGFVIPLGFKVAVIPTDADDRILNDQEKQIIRQFAAAKGIAL